MNSNKDSGHINSNAVCLVAIVDAKEVKVYPLEDGENLIGRWDPEAIAFPEIDLTEVDPEAKISRKHAIVERKGALLTLRDIGSRNGTFLNDGTQLPVGSVHPLADGEHFVVGKTHLLVKAV